MQPDPVQPMIRRIHIDAKDVPSQFSESDLNTLNDRYKSLAVAMSHIERRLPFVFEFLGTPRAGKTTVRNMVGRLGEKAGLRVFCPPEGASLPSCRGLRENLVAFNSWTGCYALSTLLAACVPANQWDVVLFDRGIIDASCWLEMLRRKDYATDDTANAAESFFALANWTARIDGMVLMTCNASEIERRERDNQLARGGRLATDKELISELMSVYHDEPFIASIAKVNPDTRLIEIDSSKTTPKGVAFKVAEEIAAVIEERLDPMVVTLPASVIGFKTYRSAGDVALDAWQQQASLTRRSRTETDLNRKQLVAHAFIEVGDKLFRVHRTGPANRPELASRLSLCVGGHVEKVDWTADIRESLERCLRRELSEELLFDAEPEIELCGFINDESIDAGRYHVAAIYRVRLPGGRVRVRPGVYDQEFGEKSWALVPRERAFADVAQFDPWSRHIIEHLFGGPAFRPDAQGFLPLEIEAKHS